MSAAPSSSPTLVAAASSAATSNPAASVTVEDASTKRCSTCLADRPESAYSSAQLKKKGKRVCSQCVAHKAGAAAAQQEATDKATAAARKEAMKDAFATRLNAVTPEATAAPCFCCRSKAAVRFSPCIRCTDQHDCDFYLETKRTMPTARIPEEDRFASENELSSLWSTLLDHLRSLPASVSEEAIEVCSSSVAHLSEESSIMRPWDWPTIRHIYSPCVSAPWWSPDCCKRLRIVSIDKPYEMITGRLVCLSILVSSIMKDCAIMITDSRESGNNVHNYFRGRIAPISTANLTSGCLLPGRLLHKLLTLLIFIVRALPVSWLRTEFDVQPQVESDLFGLLPTYPIREEARQFCLGYVQHENQRTGQRTLVPLVGESFAGHKFCCLSQHLGYNTLKMVLQDDKLVLDRGLFLTYTGSDGFSLSAATGWTGRLFDSFTAAPMATGWAFAALLERSSIEGTPDQRDACLAEIAARKRPDYFHIILAIQSMVPAEDWPSAPSHELFIATPQLGLESELVELELLESLAEEAAAGNKQAQRLIAHIEDECNRIKSQDAIVASAESVQPSSSGDKTVHPAPLTIADILAQQRAWMQRMIDEQLLIHAEAVDRAESRRRIKEGRVAGDASDSSASASTTSTAAGPSSALAPTSAASSASSSSSSQLSSADAGSASAGLPSADSPSLVQAFLASSEDNDGFAYSWTSAYSSLESMREPGRKKYKTITSAALRFLHTLRPVSVNRSGGSHTVFHFASGKPVTLVRPHGGDGSVSRHAATRLYAVLHEAALRQLNPTEALPTASSGRRAALIDVAL